MCVSLISNPAICSKHLICQSTLFSHYLSIYLTYPVCHLPHFPFFLVIVFWRENCQFSYSESVSGSSHFCQISYFWHQFFFRCSLYFGTIIPAFSRLKTLSHLFKMSFLPLNLLILCPYNDLFALHSTIHVHTSESDCN